MRQLSRVVRFKEFVPALWVCVRVAACSRPSRRVSAATALRGWRGPGAAPAGRPALFTASEPGCPRRVPLWTVGAVRVPGGRRLGASVFPLLPLSRVSSEADLGIVSGEGAGDPAPPRPGARWSADLPSECPLLPSSRPGTDLGTVPRGTVLRPVRGPCACALGTVLRGRMTVEVCPRELAPRLEDVCGTLRDVLGPSGSTSCSCELRLSLTMGTI